MPDDVGQVLTDKLDTRETSAPDSLYEMIMGKPPSSEPHEKKTGHSGSVTDAMQLYRISEPEMMGSLASVHEPPPPGSADADLNAKAVLADDLLADAIGRYSKNEFAVALKRLNMIVELEPNNLTAVYHRDLTNNKLGKSHASKRDFKSASGVNEVTADQDDLRVSAFQNAEQGVGRNSQKQKGQERNWIHTIAQAIMLLVSRGQPLGSIKLRSYPRNSRTATPLAYFESIGHHLVEMVRQQLF